MISPNPYGVNAWNWPLSTCKYYNKAGFKTYRLMVNWRELETSKGTYAFDDCMMLQQALESAKAYGARFSLCIYDSAEWARSDMRYQLSVQGKDFANFTVACVAYCESKIPGVVEAVEVCNEEPSNSWLDEVEYSKGTYTRDSSWFYADILKKTYETIHSYAEANDNTILVIMDGMWEACYHHLIDLFAMGCGPYFDRINFHYYLIEQRITDEGKPEDPEAIDFWHLNTHLHYVHHLAKCFGFEKKVWISEYGWRYDMLATPDFEQRRATYNRALLEVARCTGFVDKVMPYVGTGVWTSDGEGYQGDQYDGGQRDGMDILVVDNHAQPTMHKTTPLYDMYKQYHKDFPIWKSCEAKSLLPKGEVIDDVSGWETWCGGEIKADAYFASASVQSDHIEIGPNGLYEVSFLLQLSTEPMDGAMMYPHVEEFSNDHSISQFRPPNYYGICDTRNYPGGWREIRFMYYAKESVDKIRLELILEGDAQMNIKQLNLTGLDLR